MEKENTKAALRAAALAARARMTEEERQRASLILTERIIGHQWFYRADTLLIFASFGTEIDTTEIIEEALRKGKRVFLPRVEGQDMRFYRISGMSGLTAGYRGIREPAGGERYEYREEAAEDVLLVMPGAAFDAYRNRIGYGKGFYDRFLADKPALQVRSIAVGFQCQLVEEIPAGEWDIRPYQVILV